MSPCCIWHSLIEECEIVLLYSAMPMSCCGRAHTDIICNIFSLSPPLPPTASQTYRLVTQNAVPRPLVCWWTSTASTYKTSTIRLFPAERRNSELLPHPSMVLWCRSNSWMQWWMFGTSWICRSRRWKAIAAITSKTASQPSWKAWLIE